MKKLFFTASMAILVAAAFSSCNHDENDIKLSDYDDWRAENDQWLQQIQSRKNPDGSPYYRTLIPIWNPEELLLPSASAGRACK